MRKRKLQIRRTPKLPYVVFDEYGELDGEVAKTLPKALKKARRILQKVAEEGNVDAVTIYKEVCTLRLKDPL